MKISILQRIVILCERIVNSLHLRGLLKPLYYFFYKDRKNKELKKRMQNNGLKILSEFHECLTSHNIPYTLAFGTLLGAIREHGFIKHDFDIDTFMWIDDYNSSVNDYLIDAGFTMLHSFKIEDGKYGLEQTYEKEGVHIDIFFIYPPVENLPYCCDFLPMEFSSYVTCMKVHGFVQARRLEMPFIKERRIEKFEGLDLYVPANSEELLTYRYGDDYMVPNPNWSIQSHNNNIVVWENKKGIYADC